MNQTPNDPKNPDPASAAWEEAMSRDFDARVRDLHEAPLDFDTVKGRATKIRRNRRAAVAGGVLGVAAIVTPFAVLAGDNGDTSSREPDFAPEGPSETAVEPRGPGDYLLDGTWHQADGDEVDLPESDQPYQAATLWDGNLVATRWGGEVFQITVVVAEDGTLLDTLDTAGPVVVDDAGTTAAWVDTEGQVIVSTEVDDEVVIGTVDLAAPGETVAWNAAALDGGPSCLEDGDGCTVFVNSNLGEESRAYSSLGTDDVVAPGVTKVFDATDDGAVSVINDVDEFGDTCGGIYQTQSADYSLETCDHQVQQIARGGLVAAPQSQYDGIGPTRLSILDVDSGRETGVFERDGWTVSTWVWSSDEALALTAFEGGTWHLMSMGSDGTVTELADPVAGDDFDNPFTLVQR